MKIRRPSTPRLARLITLAAILIGCFATLPAPAQVIPGDTFNITIVGANSANQAAFLVAPLTSTFGSTQMFAGAGLGNQTVTVSSSQSLSAGFITATIMISVPTNFVPVGTTIGGMAVTQIFMQMGGFNAGTNTLDFQNPLIAAMFSGSATFGANQTIALAPTTQLSNGNRSLAASEGVQAGGADISPFAVRAFSFSARFPAPTGVPETGDTYLLLGCSIAVLLFFRRRMGATQD